MRHMCLSFLLLMIFMSSVFADDNFGKLSQSFNEGYRTGYATGGGRWSGVTSGLKELNEQVQQQQQAQAYAQAVAQYQQQVQQQQQPNQGNIQGREKIFSMVAYSDLGTAQNAYNDFVAGRQNFNGGMFTLNIVKDASFYSVFNSLNVNQLTTVYQGTDGRYYIVKRIQ